LATLKLPTRLTITVAWNVDSGIRCLLAEHATGAEDARAVDRRIQATEELLRRGDIRGHAGFIGHVGAEVADIGLAQVGDGGSALVVVDVEQRRLAAAGDEAAGHGQAQAGDATGDDGAGIGKLHAVNLLRKGRHFTRWRAGGARWPRYIPL
jgi:hypothetical protein